MAKMLNCYTVIGIFQELLSGKTHDIIFDNLTL